MENNTIHRQQLSKEYFWAETITFEESAEAAKRWNAYPKLVEVINEILRFEGALRYVMPQHLNSADNFIAALDNAKKILQEYSVEENNYVVIFPGAGRSVSKWEPEKFEEVADFLVKNNYKVII